MTDTLSVDTLRIAEWRTKPEFDYTVEFKGSSFSLWDWFTDKFNQIMQDLFRFQRNDEAYSYSMISQSDVGG